MSVGEKHSVLLGVGSKGEKGGKNQEVFSLQSPLALIPCPEIGKKR